MMIISLYTPLATFTWGAYRGCTHTLKHSACSDSQALHSLGINGAAGRQSPAICLGKQDWVSALKSTGVETWVWGCRPCNHTLPRKSHACMPLHQGYGLRHTWAYTEPSTSHEPLRPKVVVEIFPGSRASSMTKPAHIEESLQLPAKLALGNAAMLETKESGSCIRESPARQ